MPPKDDGPAPIAATIAPVQLADPSSAFVVGATYRSKGPQPRTIVVQNWDGAKGLFVIAPAEGEGKLISTQLAPTTADMWERVTS